MSDFDIRHSPSYSLLDIHLQDGEEIVCEAGAMASMDSGLDSRTERAIGIFGSIIRKLFGGESVYITRYTGPGSIQLAPTLTGEVRHHSLEQERLILQPGAFLASSPDIDVTSTFAGVKAMIGKEGTFLLEANGTGDLFFNAYGSIYEVEVDGRFVCDTGHMVAFEPQLDYHLKTSGSLFSTFFSGEGFVFEFHGNGTLYMQTRHLQSFVDWLSPMLPR